jgi:hypothetical protein
MAPTSRNKAEDDEQTGIGPKSTVSSDQLDNSQPKLGLSSEAATLLFTLFFFGFKLFTTARTSIVHCTSGRRVFGVVARPLQCTLLPHHPAREIAPPIPNCGVFAFNVSCYAVIATWR